MAIVAVGARVGAIREADAEVVVLFGYGVYDGDHLHPEYGFPNPKITLDNGNVVWGCECWWGAEDLIKQKIGERRVEIYKPEA